MCVCVYYDIRIRNYSKLCMHMYVKISLTQAMWPALGVENTLTRALALTLLPNSPSCSPLLL
jgi:hypothetical protein